VILTRPFWLGRTEVTQAQWQAIMGGNPSNFKGEDLPVDNVSWDDAMEFCRKLTERERAAGHLPKGYAYTLPTEAQWEYACRAGTTGDHAGDLDVLAWYNRNSGGTPHPVGTKQVNEWGLYDMEGNVWELCADWLDDYPGGDVTNPKGPSWSLGDARVIRGGSWANSALEGAHRDGNPTGDRSPNLGFRLALAPAAVVSPPPVTPTGKN
jgi:formylglycine-generating enzyme required for sulfatase activity